MDTTGEKRERSFSTDEGRSSDRVSDVSSPVNDPCTGEQGELYCSSSFLRSSTGSSVLPSPNGSTLELQGSRGTSEIESLLRKDNELTEMCLFLAKTLSELSSSSALESMLCFLVKSGFRSCLQAVKQSGLEGEWINFLCASKMKQPSEAKIVLCIVFLVVLNCDASVLSEESTIEFFLSSLVEITSESDNAFPSQQNLESLHWSNPKKRKIVFKSNEKKLSEQLFSQICAVEKSLLPALDSKIHELGETYLLELVMRQNNSSSSRLENIHDSIMKCNGLERIVKLLAERVKKGKLDKKLLMLLELLTISPAVEPYVDQLSNCFQGLLHITGNLRDNIERLGSEIDVLILRVLTNISGVRSFLASENCAISLESYLGDMLFSKSNQDLERLPFALCCAINIAKKECRSSAKDTPFCSAFLPDDEISERFSILIEHLFQHYQSDDTEHLVIAGYYALLVGVLSLVGPQKKYRIPIITCLSSLNTVFTMSKVSRDQPMTFVVAVMQEFLLFQSSAGTLYQCAFVEISEIIDRIVADNQISVSNK